jgi:hypothetical protein
MKEEKKDKTDFAPVTRTTFLVMLGCRSESIARANVSEMGIVFNMLKNTGRLETLNLPTHSNFLDLSL